MKRIFLFLVLMFTTFVAPALATVQDVNVVPPAPPIAPTNISVSGITDTTATVSFVPVDSASQYTVYVNGQQFTGSNAPGITITGLTPYTSYSVTVSASNAGGDSVKSSPASFVTLPPIPPAPTGITVSTVTNSSALVNWQPLPPGDFITSYRIYVDGQVVSDVQPQTGVQSANLTNLDSGNHTVQISGINANMEGALSQPISFNCSSIPAPTGLIMTNHSADTLWLQWDQLSGAISYSVYINNQLIGKTGKNDYTLSGLQANTSYNVTIIGNMPDGNQSLPAVAQLKTLDSQETLTISGIEQTIFSYVNDVMPEILVLFSVVAALTIARYSKLSFRRI